jgi:hypothetical protein
MTQFFVSNILCWSLHRDEAKVWTVRGSNLDRDHRLPFLRQFEENFQSHPASYFFPGGKVPGRKVKHSPLSRASVQNEWSYTSVPLIRLHTRQGQLHFYFSPILYVNSLHCHFAATARPTTEPHASTSHLCYFAICHSELTPER